MTIRKPGDYVVNDELTEKELQWFVQDCVASGGKDRSGNCSEYPLTGWNRIVNDIHGRNTFFIENSIFRANNVTHEYAQKGASMNKDKRIEELEQRVAQLEKQCIENTEPKDEPVTEDHVGRLVMFRDCDNQEWDGPCVLNRIVHDDNKPYIVGEEPWRQAKLYKGPTRPNWIEHDGKGVPEEVKDVGKALVQKRHGRVGMIDHLSAWWNHEGMENPNDVVRYTIIEP